MSERRSSLRRRTLLNGRIDVERLNGWTIDCTVRNVSETGARVALPALTIVPGGASLSISDGQRRPARLIWHRDGHAGVEFLARPDDAAASPASPDSRAPMSADATTRLATRVAAIAARRPTRRFTRP